MPKSIEEMRIEKAAAKIRIAEEKKLAKIKPKKPKKEKKYADGGEEQFESVIAPPRPVKGKTGRDGRPLYETYQLETGEWSYSPRQLGAISLYGISANRCYGLDEDWNVMLKTDAYTTRVWFYYNRSVHECLASDPIAIGVRQRYAQIFKP